MDLSWTTDEYGGLALVTARVHNPGTVPRRVRIDNRLDGPVLPPRRGGAPEPGFDADGVTLGIPPDASRAIGFACPAPTREPPLAIVDVERTDDASAVAEPDSTVSALAELGDARPPRDAVPRPADRGRGPCPENGDAATDGERIRSRSPAGRSSEAHAERSSGSPAEQSAETTATSPPWPTNERSLGPPVAVADWLDDVENRVEYGERLTDASVPEATTVLGEADGLSAVDRLDARLPEDARALRAVADRATALAERAERADVPLDALRRLA